MPNRMVRDDLLTSERYWACSPEARCLYVSVLLSADDCARYTGSNFALRTKCMAGSVTSERVENLLVELLDADLVRVYEHDGARFLFVPRFKQRLRYTNSRYPSPPPEISDLVINKTDSGQTKASPKTAEVKRSEVNPLAQTSFARFWDSYPKKRSRGQAEKAWAKLKPDEHLTASILQAVLTAKTSVEWQRNDGQFIPHPASWLNAKGWLDEVTQASGSRLAL